MTQKAWYCKDPNNTQWLYISENEEPPVKLGGPLSEWSRPVDSPKGFFVRLDAPEEEHEKLFAAFVMPIIGDDTRELIEMDLKLRAFIY